MVKTATLARLKISWENLKNVFIKIQINNKMFLEFDIYLAKLTLILP
jgi:hypothetical protein